MQKLDTYTPSITLKNNLNKIVEEHLKSIKANVALALLSHFNDSHVEYPGELRDKFVDNVLEPLFPIHIDEAKNQLFMGVNKPAFDNSYFTSFKKFISDNEIEIADCFYEHFHNIFNQLIEEKVDDFFQHADLSIYDAEEDDVHDNT